MLGQAAVVVLTALPSVSIEDCSNPLDCLGQAVTSTASSTLLGGLGSAFMLGSEQMAQAAFASLDETTAIDLSAEWFRGNVGVIAAITLPLIVGLLVIQVIGSVLRRESAGLVRAVVGVGKALIGAALALAVAQVSLTAVDGICDAIAASAGTTVGEAAARFFDFARVTASVAPGLQFVFGLMMMVGFALLWALMVFRNAALLLVAVFAPVAFAGQVWDATRAWTRRWLEVVAALVLCKVVIVVVFVLGASAFSGTGPTVGGGTGAAAPEPAFTDLLVGMLLLSIAMFAPWLTWRFVHWGGLEAATAMNASLAANPVQSTARSTTRLGTSVVQQVGVSAALGAVSGGGGAAAAAARGGAGSRVRATVATSTARPAGPTRPAAPPATGPRR